MSQTSYKWLVSILFDSNMCYQVVLYKFWPLPLKVGDVIYEWPLSFFLSIVVYVMLSVCLSMTLYFSGVPSTDLFTQDLLCAIRANFDLRNEKNKHKSQFNICNWKKNPICFSFFLFFQSSMYCLVSKESFLVMLRVPSLEQLSLAEFSGE